MKQITAHTAAELLAAMEKRELSARQITAAYLEQIEKTDRHIGAYLTVTAKEALAAADAADTARRQGRAGSLCGLPVAVKDNICTAGVRTTCASKMLADFTPPYSATAFKKLQAAGAVLLGKTNMDEFAMGSTTENSHFHPTKNPVDPTRVPGGSSGGSAAAVASRQAPLALGSDTGGSIRQPAAYCGVVGLKPTYGAVSRYGLVAFASSLDQIGPLANTVEDVALLYDAICGHDPRDATSAPRDYTPTRTALWQDISGLKIALPREYFGPGLSAPVKQGILAAARRFEQLGAEIVETTLPSLNSALPAYYVISSAEASSNLARFDGVKYGFRAAGFTSRDEIYLKSRSQGFGAEVKRRIMLGSFVLSAGYFDAYYKQAQQVRTLVVQDFARILDTCDMVLSPVAPTTAYKLGEKQGDPMQMYLGDVYTVPVNIAGLPAVSLPCGRDEQGLPVGMQLIGRHFGEAQILRAAHHFAQSYREERA